MILINLFSVFDPTSYFNLSLNWLILLIVFMYIYTYIYVCSGGYSIFLKNLIFIVNNLFKELAENKFIGIILLRVIRFFLLIISNLLGLIPFIFTSTAHAIFTIGLGVCLWISFFFIGFIKNFKNRIAHLVPEGSPIFLSPIIVIIESIRHIIRPFTLSIRLAANIIAGHLIIGLISRIRILNYFGFISSLFLQRIILVLELGVAVIQGFVFRILILLYSLEYY